MSLTLPISPRTTSPAHYWGIAILLAFLLHTLLFWKLQPWFHSSPQTPPPLEVEFVELPSKPKPLSPSIKQAPAQIPPENVAKIAIPPKRESPQTLNDLVQKQEAEKLSMKLLKSSQASLKPHNPDLKTSAQGETQNLSFQTPQAQPVPFAKSSLSRDSVSESQTPPTALTTPSVPSQTDPSATNTTSSSAQSQSSETSALDESKTQLALLTQPTPNHKESMIITKPSELKSQNSKPLHETETVEKLPPLPADYFLNKNEAFATPPNHLSTPNKPARKTNASSFQNELTPTPPPPGTPDTIGEGQFFTLSDYNWPYESYMGRWAKSLLYGWNNNPPMDYITGQVPQGGEVFVMVTIDQSGILQSYEVTQIKGASLDMENSVVDAVIGSSNLPPLPEDFQGTELTVHFRFIYPSIR
ncbi:hypothetical protein WDW89_19095 [Deltaproteobacteria bacterium TL4]